MITGELRNKVDQIWQTIWTGGITSPITVLEQITYLMFMKLLDDNQLKAEANAAALGVKLKERVFKDGVCVISEEPHVEAPYADLRWSKFRNLEPGEMFKTVQNYVFPFIKQIGEGRDTAFSRYMKDTVFLIPTPKVLPRSLTTSKPLTSTTRTSWAMSTSIFSARLPQRARTDSSAHRVTSSA